MSKKQRFSINPANKKLAKKSLDEIAQGANKIIGDNIQGGWLEEIGTTIEVIKEK